MKLSDQILEHVKNAAKDIRFGDITIEINEEKDKVDVISRSRERFKKDGDDKDDFRRG